ncbi:MAG: pilus assembly protein [Thermomicrobiales bacterium]
MSTRFHPYFGRSSTAQNHRSRHTGQAVIEFAAIGLLLATMAFGAIELGRAYNASISVTNAARDAARVAMNPATSDADVIAAANAAAESINLTSVDVDRSYTEGEWSTITVSYEFNTVVPLVSQFWGGGPLTISESSTSRVGWDN